LVRKLERKRPLGRSRNRGMIILKRILKKQGVMYGLDSTGTGQDPMAGSCEHGNKTFTFHN